ncbi:MAG TPA: class I SAM-dependent methyltransferase [Mycobacteriales bacterium]|jgi:SAM-dependent methyltransferase
MSTSTSDLDPYVLGAADQEQQRLILQSDAYEPATEDALRRAGVGPGMDVLDVATGPGGVALIAARLVGARGRVTAVDRSAQMVTLARRRVAAAGYGTDRVRVEQADLTAWTPPQTYDAVVGRLILMHLEDPVGVLRRLAAAVRPGGVLVMADFVMSASRQQPPGPQFTAGIQRILDTFQAVGRPTDFGLEVPSLYRAAGLPSPQMALGGVVEYGADGVTYAMLAEVTRTLLPVMERTGIVHPGRVVASRLEADLRAEATALDATALPPLLVTAWSRL